MKPINNRIFCIGCRHTKMLFESQSKADNFIRFNRDEIAAASGRVPARSYYCSFCCGWHVTSVEDREWAVVHDRHDEETWDKILFLSGKISSDSFDGMSLHDKLGSFHNLAERCRLLLLRINPEEARNIYKTLVLEFSLVENLAHRQRISPIGMEKVRIKLKYLQSAFDIIEEYDIDSDTRQKYLDREDTAGNKLAVDYFRNKEFAGSMEAELDNLQQKGSSLDKVEFERCCDEIASMINANKNETLTPVRRQLLSRLRDLRIEHHRKTNPKPDRVFTRGKRSLYLSIIDLLEKAHEAINNDNKLRCSNLLKTVECLMPDSDDESSRILWAQIEGLRSRLEEL